MNSPYIISLWVNGAIIVASILAVGIVVGAVIIAFSIRKWGVRPPAQS